MNMSCFTDVQMDPWVTQGGADPLPLEEEHCSVVEVTEEDIQNSVKFVPSLSAVVRITVCPPYIKITSAASCQPRLWQSTKQSSLFSADAEDKVDLQPTSASVFGAHPVPVCFRSWWRPCWGSAPSVTPLSAQAGGRRGPCLHLVVCSCKSPASWHQHVWISLVYLPLLSLKTKPHKSNLSVSDSNTDLFFTPVSFSSYIRLNSSHFCSGSCFPVLP